MSLHISLSPNTEPADTWQAFKTLFAFWRWRSLKPVQAVENHLSEYLQQPVVAVSSGRASLAAVLQAYEIGEGDEVIVQGFTCVAVPAAVSWTGAVPVVADIAPDTYNLDPASVAARITSQTRAIVVQHTFGLPGPINALRRLADAKGLLLIEDCAHALGAMYQGKLVGTLGDAAIFSFGRDKAISCVFGGAVTARDHKIIDRIRTQQAALPLPPVWWVKQQLAHPLLMPFIKRTYFMGGIGKALLVMAQHLRMFSKAVTKAERSGSKPNHVGWRFSPALALILLPQLQKLTRYTEARQTWAAEYAKAKVTMPVLQDGARPSWLRFPLLVDDPRAFLTQAQNAGLVLGDWYRQVIFPLQDESSWYMVGSCPVAEQVAAHCINLPTLPTMSTTQGREVLTFLTEAAL